jgi:L-ascorbate oxidase
MIKTITRFVMLGCISASTLSTAKVTNPPDFSTQKSSPSQPPQVSLTLNVAYKEGLLYNPVTGRNDRVKLRQYVDPERSNPSFIAPTISVNAGEKLFVQLNNQLPAYTRAEECENLPHNALGCFNTTNLHTHGLWVEPGFTDAEHAGDNVFISLAPQQSQKYLFDIPNDHPAGTFWYHSHLHGSTALQVTSGMAGALIVKGTRVPQFNSALNTYHKTGDFDLLWSAAYPQEEHLSFNQKEHDKIMVFQQIQYSCSKTNSNKPILTQVRNSKDELVTAIKFNCSDKGDEIGRIESESIRFDRDYSLLGPNDWRSSGRYTSINGAVLSQIDAKQHDFYRWRMIHAGVRDTIGLKVFKLPHHLQPNLITQQNMKTSCENAALNAKDFIHYHIVAQDGLTTNRMRITDTTVLQPGYRYDAILRFPSSGLYCVIDQDLAAANSINTPTNTPLRTQILGWVNVTPKASQQPQPSLQKFLSQLVDQTQMNSATKTQVKQQLLQGNLAGFVPHPSLQIHNGIIGKQALTFGLSAGKFGVSHKTHDVEGAQPYDINNLSQARFLTLGQVDEWTLTSRSPFGAIGHPFHIHVNPFQIQHVYKLVKGRKIDISNNLATTDPNYNPEFNNIRGLWKDTIFVPADHEVVVRTRYTKFSGDFVLHCHILDHEDQGMMQNVRICANNDPSCKTRPFTNNHQH